MSVSEKNGQIRFLHDLKTGPAQKSYGIQVAHLAGVPQDVVSRAKEILKQLESGHGSKIVTEIPQLDLFENFNVSEAGRDSLDLQSELMEAKDKVAIVSEQMSEAQKQIEKLKAEMARLKNTSEQIQKLNLNQMTPIQALQFISDVQSRLQ